MARKRLNRKVAIIGLAVLAVLVLGLIGLFILLMGNPKKFIEDGDRAVAEKNYEAAEKSYEHAIGKTKSDALRIDIIHKLEDVYIKMEDWRKILGCWEAIIQIDPGNVQARLAKLCYSYIVADSGVTNYWQTIETQVTDFFKNVNRDDIVGKLSDYKSFDPNFQAPAQRIDCFLYLLLGRTCLENAGKSSGPVIGDLAVKAMDNLQKAKEIEPDNADIYLYLAQAIMLKGESDVAGGKPEEKEKAADEAIKLLKQSVDLAKDKEKANINLVTMKLVQADKEGLEAVKKLENECISLTQQFPSSSRAYMKLADYFALLGPKNIDKEIEAIEKAVQLDKENVLYQQVAARLYYYQFAIYERKSPQMFEKAVQTLNKVLDLPGAKDTPGPYRSRNIRMRLAALEFLNECYVEQLLIPFEKISEQKREQLLSDFEKSTHEIEQIFGSGDNPAVAKWQGMLEMAKGNGSAGIKKLYSIYQQLKASGSIQDTNPFLPYILARSFQNTNEQGAVTEFLNSAMRAGIARASRPEALLEYSEALLRLDMSSQVISNIELYDQVFGATKKSRSLKMVAYMGAGQFDKAQQILDTEPVDDPNTLIMNMTLIQARIKQVRANIARQQIESSAEVISSLVQAGAQRPASIDEQKALQTELVGYENSLSQLTRKLLKLSPSSVSSPYITAVCENYLASGRIDEAKQWIDTFIKALPDNITLQFYQRFFSEPQPEKLSVEKRENIEEAVYKNIKDPVERALNLGMFYKRVNKINEAIGQFRLVIGDYLTSSESLLSSVQNDKDIQSKISAVDSLFNIALQNKDWQLADQIKDDAKRKNLDGCGGDFYAARIAAVKKEPQALQLLNECEKQRPVFSYLYLIRSNVNTYLGNEQAALEDAKKAAMFNPIDSIVVKNLAVLLYQRNEKLGKSASEDQKEEFKVTFDRAMKLNVNDSDLYNLYAEYISPTEPVKAVSVLYYLYKSNPTVDSAVRVGRMATKVAQEQTEPSQKNAFLNMAETTLQQAKTMEPRNQQVLYAISELYRAKGEQKKAETFIAESNDPQLLWVHYYQTARYEQAEKILNQLCQANPKDVKILRGLCFIAEKIVNRDNVQKYQDNAQKYTEQLLSVEDNLENRLLQIQIFLNVGLLKEAENKLGSFMERYPNEPKGRYVKAWVLKNQGSAEKALDEINKCLESDKNDASAWKLRGQIYLQMANYEKAISDFDQSKLLSDDPEAKILLAGAYFNIGRYENGIAELRELVDAPSVANRARSMLERIYIRLGRNDALKQFYADILKKEPDNVFWYNRTGSFALKIKDLKSAQSLFERAFQISSKLGSPSSDAFNGYLEALLLSGQTDKLFEEAKKHLEDDLATIALIEMADAANRLGQKEQAFQYARQAADKSQNNQVVFYQTISSMYKIFGKEQTEAYCEEKISQNPDSLPVNLTMYEIDMANNNYDRAFQRFDKCIEVVKQNSAQRINLISQKAQALYQVYVKTSDNNYIKRAMAEYESLLKELPKDSNAEILNNFAFLLADSNEKLSEALTYIKRACELKPNNPEFLDTYALVLFKSGKYSEAAQYLESAIQLFSARKTGFAWSLYERLGTIKEKLGSQAQALAAYKQALDSGADELSDQDKQRINDAIQRLSAGEK